MSEKLEKSLQENYQFGKSNPIFLSHRHDDKENIKKAVGFLAQFGQRTYIDWLDHDMPEITSSKTAEKLKEKINKSKKFVLLATPNSIKSIWIPWELGIADGSKGLQKIAILPLIHSNFKWDEREYYGLYSYIEQVEDGRWGVFQNGQSNGTELGEWFES
ncbi:toll/interleukin-1 receptor domain-containing protein [Paenibacillus hunanensis]|uniref:TIR domain-containing protein n=1 Tax=Paenibacillus hunanensis TaxID=539262 RepID=A0ABU1J3P8_9BACL|nr:toll/interleukin-1 receptor domain-containing protein [Paenibacillus hunanensis]MDR6246034.1 hypothetical protein [Paenibacillus hunanensis]GGJ13632.1 hypothetical protein GCM10008022_23260 [Paenibacillus hunanensis]